jgi:hypothetical protein
MSDFKTTKIYPTLEDRELGEPNLDEDGEAVIWTRRLPFMAQQVVDLGFELPNPYGVGLVTAGIRQELALEKLAIGINGPPDTEIDFVQFDSPRVENQAVQLKLDAWVLPFLSVFATVGVFSGDATIPLKFEGSDLFPELCAITPNAPACVRTYSGVATPSYEGTNISVGFSAAMGWDKYFVALPVAYAWTEVDFLNETVTALNITPRIGIVGDLGEQGTLSASRRAGRRSDRVEFHHQTAKQGSMELLDWLQLGAKQTLELHGRGRLRRITRERYLWCQLPFLNRLVFHAKSR